MPATTLMIQGTASSVGKSLLVTGLCRWLRQRGYRVAPFKAQNLSLNAFVTADGREVGRAQAVQAHAAGIEVTVDMSPLLLKPEADGRMQIVVLGEPERTHPGEYKERLAPIVAESLARLRAQHDVVLIEGAGSPAEINLRRRDLANMHVAHLARAPVLLVGDIDRGGVFASLVGTLALMDERDRTRIAGLVINKFSGALELLQPGLDLLEARTGLPTLGVVPVIEGLRIPDEDSLSLDARATRRPRADELDLCVVRYPRASNHDDFSALEHEAGVLVRYVTQPHECETADLVVLPGSKDTRGDLAWLRERGFEQLLQDRARASRPILGVCGGFQMLGQEIDDPGAVEGGAGSAPGLGLLPVETRFGPRKTLRRVRAASAPGSFLAGESPAELAEAEGYEIHAGEVRVPSGCTPAFLVGERAEGAVRGDVVGTLLHGVFESAALRGQLLASLRERRGLAAPPAGRVSDLEREYDRLAATLDEALDMPRILGLLGTSPP